MRAACLVLLSLLLLPAPAAAAEGSIQPGDWAGVGAGCTLGWAFDGSDGAVYFGIAAHCTELGEEVFIADPAGPPAPAGPAPGESLGFVVARGADDSDVAQDVALIRVRASVAARVSGELRGHPGIPTGVIDPSTVAAQDPLQLSGWGTAFEVAPATRESRQAILLRGNELSWEGVAPVTGGDSGGPVAHVGTGAAIGFVKGGACGDSAGGSCTFWGPSIAALQRVAATLGVALTLRRDDRRPIPPVPPAEPAPAQAAEDRAHAGPTGATVTMRVLRARARSRRLTVRLTTDRPLRGVRVSVLRARRRVATATMAQVRSQATVSLRIGGRLRRGRYRVVLAARDDLGRAVRQSVAATVG